MPPRAPAAPAPPPRRATTQRTYQRVVAAVLGCVLLLWGSTARAEPAAPRVELLTMAPGGTLFDGFGHAALRVVDPSAGTEAVYTFGALSWTGPLLGWRFLRGEVLFEVRVRPYRAVLRSYRRQDRTLYRQVLRLHPAEARKLAARLKDAARPENSRYAYHHFKDNCSTRLRDLIDEATGGALRRALDRPGDGTTARHQVLRGLSLSPWLLLVMNVVLGRPTDVPLDAWALTFVPGELRLALVGARRTSPGGVPEPLAEPVEIVYERRAQLQRWPIEWGGRLAWLLALPFLCLGVWGRWSLRRAGPALRDRLAAAGLAAWALLGGTLGLVLDTVAMSEFVPEFRQNENLALYLALDLLLLVPAGLLALRRLKGRWRRGLTTYLGARAAVAGVVMLGQTVGILRQEPIAMAGLVIVGLGGLCAACWPQPPSPSERPDSESTGPPASLGRSAASTPETTAGCGTRRTG